MRSKISMAGKNIIRSIFCILLLAGACFGYGQTEIVNTDIAFYGKVVDQYYTPVTDCEVEINVDFFDQSNMKKTKMISVRTDLKGFFVLKAIGSSVHIASLIKEGYEFSYQKNNDHYFEYSSVFQKACFVADQRAPILFHMVKIKDEPAYLIHQPSQERNFLPTERRTYNLNLGGNWIDSDGQFNNSGGHVDLAIRCGLSEDKDKMELNIISMDSNSGVVATDEYLEVAPLDGYEPQAVIAIEIPERMQEVKKYVYARSRGGMMYSRLNLNLTIRPSNLLVSVDIWTNPEHSRNLKYDKAFQEYTKRQRYDMRERRYQENLRLARDKEQFRYTPRVLPPMGTVAAGYNSAEKDNNADYKGPYYHAP